MRPAIAALLLAALLALVYWAGSDAGARAERALQGTLREPQPGARGELEAALGIPNARARALHLARYFDQASPADLDTTLQTYQAAEAYIDALALVLLADWWASFDAPGALYRTLQPGFNFVDANAARYTIVRRWARQDPAAARKFVDEHRGSVNSDLLTQALVVGWSERDGVSDVWRYIEKLRTGRERQKAILALVVRSFTINGVDETLRSVEALPDEAPGNFKLQAFRRTAWALARYDPERARQWSAERSGDPLGAGLLRLVGVSLARTGGEDALEWLRKRLPGEERDQAIRESFRAWLVSDRETAIAWLRGATPDSALEPALVALIPTLGRSDPEQARALLDRIEDPGLSEAAYLALARAWIAHDREAALAWLESESVPIDEETRRRLEEQSRVPMPVPRRGEPSPEPAGA